MFIEDVNERYSLIERVRPPDNISKPNQIIDDEASSPLRNLPVKLWLTADLQPSVLPGCGNYRITIIADRLSYHGPMTGHPVRQPCDPAAQVKRQGSNSETF